MRKLRGLSVLAVACVLGLSLVALTTSPATAAKPAPSSAVVMDASTELALLGAGDVEVLSLTCRSCITDNPDCFASNCGVATPSCCCKWCNGVFDCRPKSLPGFCVAE